jgi:hypothetical protein
MALRCTHISAQIKKLPKPSSKLNSVFDLDHPELALGRKSPNATRYHPRRGAAPAPQRQRLHHIAMTNQGIF